MGRLVEHRDRDLRPPHPLGRVEQPEAEPRHEQPDERPVDLLLGDQALAHRVGEVGIHPAAIEVGARPHTQRRRRRRGLHDPVPQVHVVDRAAIGDHVAGEMPLAPQDLLQEQVATACGLAVHAVIRAHERIRAAFADRDLEVRQVALPQVPLAHHGVELMPERLRA